jgi:hypothetical protein
VQNLRLLLMNDNQNDCRSYGHFEHILPTKWAKRQRDREGIVYREEYDVSFRFGEEIVKINVDAKDCYEAFAQAVNILAAKHPDNTAAWVETKNVRTGVIARP